MKKAIFISMSTFAILAAIIIPRTLFIEEPIELTEIEKPNLLSNEFWNQTLNAYRVIKKIENKKDISEKENNYLQSYFEEYSFESDAEPKEKYVGSSIALMKIHLEDYQKTGKKKYFRKYLKDRIELLEFINEYTT